MVVLDDLQWATKPTLMMLRHVLRTTEHAASSSSAFTATPSCRPSGDTLADSDASPGSSAWR